MGAARRSRSTRAGGSIWARWPRARSPDLADAEWRALDVPHDFSIEGPPGADPATMDGPFDRKSPGGTSAGALNGGIGWYRKTFTLPAGRRREAGRVRFDGVYMDSEVWLNGVSLGKQPYGYTSFQFDLTPTPEAGRQRAGGAG